MFRNRILKILALLMVLNILIIPLTSFTPQQQNKDKVYAAEAIVDIRFFNAVISMIGITAAGLGTMSPSFSIPEADLLEMKNNFVQTLEADAVKKQAWLAAQTDYLAGGIAKTMGAVELAKIGIYDIYFQFLNYCKTNVMFNEINPVTTLPTSYTKFYETKNYIVYSDVPANAQYLNFFKTMPFTWTDSWNFGTDGYKSDDWYSSSIGWTYNYRIYNKLTSSLLTTGSSAVNGYIGMREKSGKIILGLTFIGISSYQSSIISDFYDELALYLGVTNYPSISGLSYGHVDNVENIIDVDSEYIHVFPTIPWIDETVPVGTIVTPAIAAPYAGAVPIDIPITVPIDPPIEEPVDPPAEPTLIGTVAAILAGLTPIAGFLENILAGQVSLTDVIEAGLTDVIDGIGDIAGTLTSGISSTLTDISTSITDFVNPSPETVSQLDLNPIKNIPGVLFTRFPFSIPFDFYKIIAFMGGSAREAPVFEFKIDLSSLSLPNIEKQIDMQPFDQIAGYVRIAELIAFAIAVMLKTKTLIWG